MDHHEPETEKKIERSDMSVDQILDEYWARVAEEARRAQEQREYEALASMQSEPPVRILDEDEDGTDEDGVRIYRPGAPAPAPRNWRGEGDFDLVYENGESPDGDDDYDDGDDWYEEDEEDFRPMSARDILREYWTANAPSYKVELPEEQPAPPPAEDAPVNEADAEVGEEDYEEDVAIYTPMSVRDILKEYWEDNAPSYIDVPEPEREPEPEGQSLEQAVSGEAGESLRPVAAIFGLREDAEAPAAEESAEAAAEPEALQAEAEEEEELPPPALKDILAEYWAMASELAPVEDEAAVEEAPEAVETTEAVEEVEAEETEDIEAEAVEVEAEAVEVEDEPVEAEAEAEVEEAPESEAESAEAAESLSDILASASLWERLPEDEEARDETAAPEEAAPAEAEAEEEAEAVLDEEAAGELAALAGLFAGLGKRREPEAAPEIEAEEEAEAPEGPEEEALDEVIEDEIPDEDASEAPSEDELLPEEDEAAEEAPLDEIDEITEDAPAGEAEPEIPAAELPEEEAGDYLDVEIPDPARSFEDLQELLTETPERPAPIQEPEAQSAENAGGYVYGETPEPTVREILTEYWTSGESEPIQDAQLRAEADAAQAELEQAAQQRPLEQAEVTVYQPAPVEQAAYAAPSAEDYQHTAEDLGLTVDSILADYWANIAPRPAASAAPAEAQTAEDEPAIEENTYEPEPERSIPARRRVKVRLAATAADEARADAGIDALTD
ncbi:MAG: hypothetical protein IJ179_03570, partial [Oscillospiraceae bacterium]|nr:hypothetical protein [Oscillospiraceae bacterium]